MTSAELERNRATAQDFLTTAFVDGRPEEAAARHFGDSYTQHSATAEDGIDAFIAFATELAATRPDLRLDFKRVIAEGDLVAVHFHALGLDDSEVGHAVVDIFRFDSSGKIVEHWDVIQAVPEQVPHDNGVF